MKVKYAPWIILVLVGLAVAVHADVATPDWDAAAKSWWAHVQYLAGDSLEGRETGSSWLRACCSLCSRINSSRRD